MRYILSSLSYCVDVRKCLPNAYHNQTPNPKVVSELLRLKRTPCDAYSMYPASHHSVALDM